MPDPDAPRGGGKVLPLRPSTIDDGEIRLGPARFEPLTATREAQAVELLTCGVHKLRASLWNRSVCSGIEFAHPTGVAVSRLALEQPCNEVHRQCRSLRLWMRKLGFTCKIDDHMAITRARIGLPARSERRQLNAVAPEREPSTRAEEREPSAGPGVALAEALAAVATPPIENGSSGSKRAWKKRRLGGS